MFLFSLPPVAIAVFFGRELLRRRATETYTWNARFAHAAGPLEAMSPVARETLTEVADACFELAPPDPSRVDIDIEPFLDASGRWSNHHSLTFLPEDAPSTATSPRLEAAVRAVLREMLARGTPVAVHVVATRLADDQVRVNARFSSMSS